MSLFDYYRPMGEMRCPICHRLLHEWQGKDGPNGLFVWAQGARSPVDQVVDEESRADLRTSEHLTLPGRFLIYSYDCPDHQPVEAECTAEGGVWRGTVVLPFKHQGRA
jgi:hypothetical protein